MAFQIAIRQKKYVRKVFKVGSKVYQKVSFFWRLPNAWARQNPSKNMTLTTHSASHHFLTQVILSSQKINPSREVHSAPHLFPQQCSVTTYCRLQVHAVVTAATGIHHKNGQNQKIVKGKMGFMFWLLGVRLLNHFFFDGTHWPQSHPNPSLERPSFWQNVLSEGVLPESLLKQPQIENMNPLHMFLFQPWTCWNHDSKVVASNAPFTMANASGHAIPRAQIWAAVR